MTGVPDSPSARFGMEHGADDYLPKPFDMETLVASVRARLDRQQAIEAHAKANEKTLLEILSTTPDLVAIADATSGRLRYLNASGRRMLAIGPKEELSELRLGEFHADAETAVSQREKVAWAKRYGSWMGESALVSREGKRVPVSKQILAHRSAEGEVIYLSIVVRDITERLAAEQALRESEKRYRELIESQGDGVVLVDADQRLTFANPAADELLGVQAGGLVGRYLQEFLPEADRATVREQVKLRREGKRSSYELEIIAGGGRQRQLLVSANPRIDGGGRFCGSLLVLRDITEQKQAGEQIARSEQLLRTILDVLPQRVFWKDRKGRYIGANNQFLADCGMSNVAGKTDFDMPWPRHQADSFRADDRRVIESGSPHLDIVEQITRATGETMWLSTSKVPMRNEQGEVVGVLGTYLDLTLLKRAEQERQMMEVQLRQAQKLEAIGQLAAGIAHEINTPVQYVGDNTRFLQDSFQNIRKVLEIH
jgi:PAS domain S-box-containing protein